MTSSKRHRCVRAEMITNEDKMLICEWCHLSVAMLTVSLYRCWRQTFWTLLRPVNFSWKFYASISMHLWRNFHSCVKKRCFLILRGRNRMLTHVWWSKTPSFCDVQNSFLVNALQKLSKIVEICRSYCKKFTVTFLLPPVIMDHSVCTDSCAKFCFKIHRRMEWMTLL